jgi:hypothetical protein
MATVQERPAETGARVGRRAALAVGALAVCGAAVAATPYVEQRVQQAERDALLAELGQLEGISIDAAIRAAELTRAAVQAIVLPLARFVALVGAGALGLLLRAIIDAQHALGLIHVTSQVLDQFEVVVASWQAGIAGLPIALSDFVDTDITSAETYLKALKGKMAAQTSSAK